MKLKPELLESRDLLAADLSISIGNGSDTFGPPGSEAQYVVEVANQGDSDATGVSVQAFADPLENLSWVRQDSGEMPVSGSLRDTIDIPAGATVRYTLYGLVPERSLVAVKADASVRGPGLPRPIFAEDVDFDPLDPPMLSSAYMCFPETHVVGDTMYFIGVRLDLVLDTCNVNRSYASSGFFGGNLMKTDGTPEGTSLITRIRTERWDGAEFMPEFFAPQFADLDGVLYFTATDGTHQRELWRSDGTADGTYMVKDIRPDLLDCPHPGSPTLGLLGCEAFVFDTLGSEIDNLASINGALYFTANDGKHGRELWVSDGTTEGTRMVKDIVHGLRSAFPATLPTLLSPSIDVPSLSPMFTAYNEEVYFVGGYDRELWKTDGTADGTTLVKNINPIGSARIENLRVENDLLYFDADDRFGMRTWSSDGTEAGTVVVGDRLPPALDDEMRVIYEDGAFFLMQGSYDDRILVAEAGPRIAAGVPTSITIVGNMAVFSLRSPAFDHWTGIYPGTYALDLSPYLDPAPTSIPISSGSQFVGRNDTTSDGDFGDLDSDGDLDLFITVADAGNEVWLNDGHGEFRDSGQRLGTRGHIYSAMGDVDNDGDLDVVVAGNTNTLWLNDGNGNFDESQQSLGTKGIDVALADLDGDSDLDLFVANANETANLLFLNDGDGNFEGSGQFANLDSTKSVVVADVDGDGDGDLITANNPGPSRIWINSGDATFDTSTTLDIAAEHIAAGDFDTDGDIDLVGAEVGPNRIWWNDGSGSFSNDGTQLEDGITSHVVVADLDLDGDNDIVTANWRNEPSMIWVNKDGQFFDGDVALDPEARSEHVAVGDVDADGDLDIYFAIRQAPNPLYRNETVKTSHESPARLAGDANEDGQVEFSDFLALAANFGKVDAVWADGDFDGDGVVQFSDFLVLAQNFAKQSISD